MRTETERPKIEVWPLMMVGEICSSAVTMSRSFDWGTDACRPVVKENMISLPGVLSCVYRCLIWLTCFPMTSFCTSLASFSEHTKTSFPPENKKCVSTCHSSDHVCCRMRTTLDFLFTLPPHQGTSPCSCLLREREAEVHRTFSHDSSIRSPKDKKPIFTP